MPALPCDLRREHRLYEADWLLRFYGFSAEELLPVERNLAADIDVKSFWALNNYQFFPVEINTASYEALLRVPGIGVKNAYRIIIARRHGKLTFESLKNAGGIKRAQHFITVNGKFTAHITIRQHQKSACRATGAAALKRLVCKQVFLTPSGRLPIS